MNKVAMNKVLVRRFVEAMNTRQLDMLDEILTPNVVRHCQATPDVDVRSLTQFKDFLKTDLAGFPDNIQTITQILAEGDLVAAWATYEGTQMGEMRPFPPSGKKVQFEFGFMLRVENGKIAEWWVTWDNMTVLTQLGHLPA